MKTFAHRLVEVRADRLTGAVAARVLSVFVIALAGTFGSGASVRAAELLMFEQDGCPFCRRFDEEIAPAYPRSDAGQRAPLRRVNIFEDRRGGIPGLSPAVFTPTFVVVDDDNREVGRLEGYPGEKWFYPEIETLTDKLPVSETTAEVDRPAR